MHQNIFIHIDIYSYTSTEVEENAKQAQAQALIKVGPGLKVTNYFTRVLENESTNVWYAEFENCVNLLF